jgi:FtsH-binding integral membrane protein
MKNRTFILSALGFELTGLIVGSIFIAAALEERIPSRGLWTAGLIVLAFAGWFIHALHLLKKMNSEPTASQRSKGQDL